MTPPPKTHTPYESPVTKLAKAQQAALTDRSPLVEAETIRLAALERVIERGKQTFIEVGEALAEIRTKRLYRETHATFEEYLRKRWGMGRSQAYRLIDASGVVAAMSPIGDKPASEAQARALAPRRMTRSRWPRSWRRWSRTASRPPRRSRPKWLSASLDTPSPNATSYGT